MSNSIDMYCMECEEWLYDWGKHQCPSGYWVVTDKQMVGIASKLYAMGITPLSSIWTATDVGPWEDYEYLITLKIDIDRRISEAILGELPEGWKYHWETITPDKLELHMLAYTERWHNLGFEDLGTRIIKLIKEFEKFLRERDAEAVKALMLLTSC